MEKLKNQENITSITQHIFHLFIKTNSIYFLFPPCNQTEPYYSSKSREFF
ncbi:hypothetical protein LguiB_006307 [Lonicera macranthoides]